MSEPQRPAPPPVTPPGLPTLDVREAVVRARAMASGSAHPVLLGVTGAPGAGKSHVAALLAAAVEGSVVVGMDGYHLAHSVLVVRGLADRKGAIDTFDGAGYVALLRRIRGGEPGTIWAPEFRRDVEDTIAGAVAVPPTTRLVVTEGNYLLVDEEPWSQIPALCDEIWYVDQPEQVRIERLVARHVRHGRSALDARRRATEGSDGVNATQVRASRERATLIVVNDATAGDAGEPR